MHLPILHAMVQIDYSNIALEYPPLHSSQLTTFENNIKMIEFQVEYKTTRGMLLYKQITIIDL